MKVLVTGATGFVGKWLVRRLLDLGHNVRVYVRHESSVDSTDVEISTGDIADAQSLVEAASGIDSVFHVAGVVGYSRAMRQQMYTANVVGTENVVHACMRNNVRRLIHLSSVVAIGASFDEHHILNEDSEFNLTRLDLGYFETKRHAEEIVRENARAGKIDAVCVNPSTIYGAGDAKKGSRNIQRKVAQGRFPFYTSGGVNVVHIEDVLDGIISAWHKGLNGERYILAGENLKIRELFEIIAGVAEVSPPRIYLPNPIVRTIGKVGDLLETYNRKAPLNSENAWAAILYHWFDSTKAQRELEFKARPAEIAIQESVIWMKSNGYL